MRTFGACRRAWPGHHRFVDGDPLKGGDEQCRGIVDVASESRTVTATPMNQHRWQWWGFPLL